MAQDSFMVRALAAFKSFLSFQFVVYFFYVGLVCSFFFLLFYLWAVSPALCCFGPFVVRTQVDSRRPHVSPTINLPRLLGQVSLVLEVLNRPYRSFKFWC